MRKILCAIILAGISALGIACSSSSDAVGCGDCHGDDDYLPPDAGSDATVDDAGSDASACVYPDDAGNDPLCPATYHFSLNGSACPKVGLACGYPGEGDEAANGCFEAAALRCNAPDAGVGEFDAAIFDDAGDSGIGYWTAAQ